MDMPAKGHESQHGSVTVIGIQNFLPRDDPRATHDPGIAIVAKEAAHRAERAKGISSLRFQ